MCNLTLETSRLINPEVNIVIYYFGLGGGEEQKAERVHITCPGRKDTPNPQVTAIRDFLCITLRVTIYQPIV